VNGLTTDVERLAGTILVVGYEGTVPSRAFLSAVHDGLVGGVIVFGRNVPPDPRQIRDATDALHEAARAANPARAPLFIGVDQEGGRVRRLPPPLLDVPSMHTVAQMLTPREAQQIAAGVATELRALGFTMTFAPVLDVRGRSDEPTLGDRAFGNDATQVSAYGASWVRGLELGGIGACGKHFPGHGHADVDSHIDLPVVTRTRDELETVDLAPFRAAVDAGVDALMSAHCVYPALDETLPATLSCTIATELLRHRMGFSGVLFSDDLEMGALAAQGPAGQRWSMGERAVAAVRAGCDALLLCSPTGGFEEARHALIFEARRDTAFRHRLEEAATRFVTLRKKYAPAVVGSAGGNEDQRTLDAAAARARIAEARSCLSRIVQVGGAAPAALPQVDGGKA
jgi:beta-N-acetylhexosaminidase